MYRLIAAVPVLILLAGCSPHGIQLGGNLLIVAQQLSAIETMEWARKSRGEGDIRIFSYPYDAVFAATLKVAEEQGLKIVEQDREKGEIMLSRGWGERVAVFMASSFDSETEVETISKEYLSDLSTPDWTNKLFTAVEKELRAAGARQGQKGGGR
jgi:hypothetical protein